VVEGGHLGDGIAGDKTFVWSVTYSRVFENVGRALSEYIENHMSKFDDKNEGARVAM
jgi:hypothetical protein